MTLCELELKNIHSTIYYPCGFSVRIFSTGVSRTILVFNNYTIFCRRGAGAQTCDCNATVVDSITIRRNKLLILNLLIFLFFGSGIKAKAQRQITPLNTQCFEKFHGTQYLSTKFPLLTLLYGIV